MIESPLIEDLLAERTQDNIIDALRVRFGEPPIDLVTRLRAVGRSDTLTGLHRHAIMCPDLDSFRARLLEI